MAMAWCVAARMWPSLTSLTVSAALAPTHHLIENRNRSTNMNAGFSQGSEGHEEARSYSRIGRAKGLSAKACWEKGPEEIQLRIAKGYRYGGLGEGETPQVAVLSSLKLHAAALVRCPSEM
jgi:hypothetical protein